MPATLVREARDDAERAVAFAIRREVFVVEQAISEQLEFDGHDGTARHLLAWRAGSAVGSLRVRLLDDGRLAKIERVAVRAHARSGKVGSALLAAALELAQTAGAREALVHAQCVVQDFYRRHGFAAAGPPFVEDGILHVAMRRPLTPGGAPA